MDGRKFHGGEALARAVEAAYGRGETDYSLEPMVLVDGQGAPVGKIRDGDHVVFCCRRGEREIELTEAFTDPAFPHFERDYMKDLEFVIMTMYHEKFKNLCERLLYALRRKGDREVDKIMFMADGVIEEMGTPEEVFGNPKSEKTKAFLSSSLEQF